MNYIPGPLQHANPALVTLTKQSEVICTIVLM